MKKILILFLILCFTSTCAFCAVNSYDRYGNKTLEHYYYDDNLDQFYWHDAELNKYRELPYISLKNGSRYVWAYETNGNRVAILIHKFKQLYNLE